MSKRLVIYFSASGVTKETAQKLADVTGADLFEIVPEEPYSAADLKWVNPFARCNREKMGKTSQIVTALHPNRFINGS